MIVGFFRDIYLSRTLIWSLAKRDFIQQNHGTYLGVIWNYLQPILFIAVLYMVFTVGFKSGKSVDGIPFSIYLVSGIISWLYFTANLNSITNVIRSHSYLVKKVNFRLSILPIIKILSSSVPHFVLIALAITFAAFLGYKPSIYTIQVLYYFLCTVVLLLGLGWLTSSTSVFIKDVNNLVAIITQFGFWLTPIFWNISNMPEKYHWIIKLNPVFYLVEGYRQSIIGGTYFWERSWETMYFWAFVVCVGSLGVVVFRRLKPHFAEVI